MKTVLGSALWTSCSSAWAIGAGIQDAGSFAFPFYCGGTILGFLLFVTALMAER